MPPAPWYFHKPGRLTRGAVLDVGLRCPHSCRFCYYSFLDGAADQFKGLRAAVLRPTGQCLEMLDLFKQHGYLAFDITGGEPAVHPGLVSMIEKASELGLASRVITLGQLLDRGRPDLLERLLQAGVTDFLFSMHAVQEGRFRAYTGGSWARLARVMDRLDRVGFQYSANTVVFQDNLDHLPDVARESARRGVHHHNFILFNAYHLWNAQQTSPWPQPRFAAVRPPLEEAVNILTQAGVAVTVRYAHLCALPEHVRHIVGVAGLQHDPHEWMNRAVNHDRDPAYCAEPLHHDHDRERDVHAITPLDEVLPGGVAVHAQRGQRFKVFAEPCKDCAAKRACDGVDPKYLAAYGAGELAPFASMELANNLAAARLAYLPAFFVKTAPFTDMRALLAELARQPDPQAWAAAREALRPAPGQGTQGQSTPGQDAQGQGTQGQGAQGQGAQGQGAHPPGACRDDAPKPPDAATGADRGGNASPQASPHPQAPQSGQAPGRPQPGQGQKGPDPCKG